MANWTKTKPVEGKMKKFKQDRFTEHAHTFNLGDYTTPEAVQALWTRDAGYAVNEGASWLRNEGGSFLGLGREDNAAAVARIVAQGDNAATNRVENARREAEGLNVAKVIARKPSLVSRRVTGQRFDLERVLSSDPLPWSRWEPGPQRAGSRFVSLYVAISGPGNLSADEMAWRPVAGLVAADLLEAAGYRVEIWGVDPSNMGNFHITHCRVNLKAACDPLDVSALARVAHPAIARGLFMPMMHKAAGDLVTSGYGACLPPRPSVFGDDDAIVVRAVNSSYECLTEVKRIIAQFQAD